MRLPPILALMALAVLPSGSPAQLRPLDPMPWSALSAPRGRVEVGLAHYRGQRLPLVGVVGDLTEFGQFAASVTLDRVIIHLDGVVVRRHDASSRYSDPVEGVRNEPDGVRSDVGDLLVATVIRLAGTAHAPRAALRFGVRLPTTDDAIGIERDETDFFVTVAGRSMAGRVELSGEFGAAINGVVVERFDQTDPFQFGAGLRLIGRRWIPGLSLVGRYDTRENGPPRGSEHLAEVRLGLERALLAPASGPRPLNLRITATAGLARFSPDWGVGVELSRSW